MREKTKTRQKKLPSLRDALERLFNFTVYPKPATARTGRRWRLNNITPQLSRFRDISAIVGDRMRLGLILGKIA